MENSLELKKEIFENRNLIRFASFFSFLSTACLVWFIIFICMSYNAYNHVYFDIQHDGLDIIFLGLSLLFALILWIQNIFILYKLKNIRSFCIPFFIASLILLFVPIILGIALMSYMKKDNKVNYLKWIKEEKNQRIEKKIYKFESNFGY